MTQHSRIASTTTKLLALSKCVMDLRLVQHVKVGKYDFLDDHMQPKKH